MRQDELHEMQSRRNHQRVWPLQRVQGYSVQRMRREIRPNSNQFRDSDSVRDLCLTVSSKSTTSRRLLATKQIAPRLAMDWRNSFCSGLKRPLALLTSMQSIRPWNIPMMSAVPFSVNGLRFFLKHFLTGSYVPVDLFFQALQRCCRFSHWRI